MNNTWIRSLDSNNVFRNTMAIQNNGITSDTECRCFGDATKIALLFCDQMVIQFETSSRCLLK